MKVPLLDTDADTDCASTYTIQAKRKIKNAIPFDFAQQMTNIAKLQIFDFAIDYDPILDKSIVPIQFYPKDYIAFKQKYHKMTFFEILLQKIPILHPQNRILLLWELGIVLIIVFYSVYIPLRVVFIDSNHVTVGDENQSSDPSVEGLQILVEVTLIPLLFDILLQFNIAYYSHGQLVTDRSKIAQNYIKTDFWLDFTASFSLILALITKVSAVRYLFFLRIYTFFRFDTQVEIFLQMKPKQKACYQLAKLFFVLLYVTHIFACLFYSVGIQQVNDGNNNSWIVQSEYNNDEQIQDYPVWDKYGISLYWSLTTIVTVGYGDITPKNKQETTIAMVTMLFAGMIFAFNVSTIRETMLAMNEQKTKFNSYMLCINRYMDTKKISADTQMRVKEYMEYLWKGELSSDKDQEMQLIGTLPPELREQLYAEACKQFLNCAAFGSQDFSEAFLKSIAQHVEEIHFGSGEQIYLQNQYDEDPCLYFVVSGSVSLYYDDGGPQNIQLAIIDASQVFNQQSFYTGEIPFLSAKCLNYTSLYKLKGSNFKNSIKHFQEDFEKYHLLLQSQSNQLFYNNLEMKCFTCDQYTHSCLNCDVTHYVPDKQLIIRNNKFNKIDKQIRERQFRGLMKWKTHAWIGPKEYTRVAENVMQERKNSVSRNRSQSSMRYTQTTEEDYILQGSIQNKALDQDHYLTEVDEIKSMIEQICLSLKINIPTSDEAKQNIQDRFIPASIELQIQEPLLSQKNISFNIDQIQSYEFFQPEFNLNVIMRDFEKHTQDFRISNQKKRTNPY